MYAAAVEIARDIPAADRVEIGTLDTWRAHELSPQLLRDCSFVALSRGEVVGYATLHAGDNDEAVRDDRRRPRMEASRRRSRA